MDILGKLFGNSERIKLIRFLILNERKAYSFGELSKRTGISERPVKKEIEHLRKSKFAKVKSELIKKENKGHSSSKRSFIVSMDGSFPHKRALKDLFIAAHPISSAVITRTLSRAGRIKLIIASGIFVGEDEGRLDLLVVGDRTDKRALDRAIHSLERSLGRDLRYALLEVSDFNYRVSVLDKLVRDVFDYPHQKLFDRMGH